MPTPGPELTGEQRRLTDWLTEEFAQLGIVTPQFTLDAEKEASLGSLRRRGLALDQSRVSSFLVVQEPDGYVRFVTAPPETPSRGRRGRRRRRATRETMWGTGQGKILGQFKFEDLEPNGVQQFLEDKIDRWILSSGPHDLQVYHKKRSATSPKRRILLIHGFISNTETMLDEIGQSDNGDKFLEKAKQHYSKILRFDHWTISLSPLLNAIDLLRELTHNHPDILEDDVEVDVICHSRGGLVTRWWLEALEGLRRKKSARVIFVGSPLGGTSLAAPPRLRAAIDWLASIAGVLEKLAGFAGTASIFARVAAVLLEVVTSVLKALSKTPLIDGAVSLLPGVAGMSRVGNNPDLLRLRSLVPGSSFDSKLHNYYVVKSNIEPEDVGWAFWRRLYNPIERTKNWAADLVFTNAANEPLPNDLIVDTESMGDLSDSVFVTPTPSSQRIYDFGTSPVVHHNNYFRQKETIDFFHDTLGVPK